MANVIKHKRGSGSDPGASDLILGELAIRTDTGKLFTKMDSGAIAEIAGGGSDIAINTLSSSSATGGGSATFNGSAYRFTLSAPPNVSAAQLLVSINGVIQKPVAGTGQPSEGFSVDGTDIILGDAPATGSDFFILTFKSLGVSEPADNSVTSAKIANGAIVDADINASAAIAGSKIDPDFGSQNINTTGTVTSGTAVLSSTFPNLSFTDADHNSDFRLEVNSGQFKIKDTTNSANRLIVQSDGTIDVEGNLDANGGLDVTGAITGTGDLTIDTNTLHVDSSNNRVGIGTTSPSTLLHIADTGSPIVLIEDTDAANQVGIRYKTTSADWIAGLHGGEGNKWKISNHSSFGTNDYLTVDTSGRVGIAQTPLSEKLEVSGAIRSTSASANFSAGAEAVFMDFISGNRGRIGTITGTGSARDLAFNIGNLEKMRINTSGNVGIGTTSPAEELVVRADAPSIQLESSNASGRNYGFQAMNDGKFHAYDGTAGVNRVTLDSSGNVGIGTTSPSDHLDVSHSANTAAGISITNTNNSQASAMAQLLIAGGDNSKGRLKIETNGAFHTIDEDSNGNLILEDNGTERMRIDSSGRLLFGTESSRSVGDCTSQIQLEGIGFASSSLSLISNAGASAGNIPHLTLGKSRGSSDGSNTVVANGDKLGVIQFAGADGTDCNSVAASILANVDGTPGSNDMPGNLTFNTTADGAASPTERLRIDSSGNVGIGTTSPSTNFHVHTSSNDSGITVKSTGNTSNAFNIDANRSGANAGIGGIKGRWNGTTVAQIGFNTGSDTTNKDDGYVWFGTETAASNGNVNATERLRIQSGGGISFNGDTAAANALDDYEEGTFAAEIVQGLGSITQTFDNSATYTKIGNLVHVQAIIQFTGVGNGTAVFLKLPFTHVTDTSLGGGVISFTNVSGLSGESTLTLVGQSGQSYCRVKNKSSDPSISGTNTNKAIYYHFTYQAA